MKILPNSKALWLRGKESACSAGVEGDPVLIPELRRSPGEGNIRHHFTPTDKLRMESQQPEVQRRLWDIQRSPVQPAGFKEVPGSRNQSGGPS